MVTATTRAQLQRLTDADGLLLLLKLEHPAIETAYVVNDTRDWVIGADTWIGLPFRFRLPQEGNTQPPRAQLEVDNVGGTLGRELEKLPPGGSLLATMRLVSRATPGTVEWEFSAPLSGVSVTTATVAATVGNDTILRSPAVMVRYDLTTAPGLFAG